MKMPKRYGGKQRSIQGENKDSNANQDLTGVHGKTTKFYGKALEIANTRDYSH